MVGGDKLADLLREAAAQLGRADEAGYMNTERDETGALHAYPTKAECLNHCGSAVPYYLRPQLPAAVPDDFYLKILVAAGHITQEVADQTRDIAQSVLAAAPQPDNKESSNG